MPIVRLAIEGPRISEVLRGAIEHRSDLLSTASGRRRAIDATFPSRAESEAAGLQLARAWIDGQTGAGDSGRR